MSKLVTTLVFLLGCSPYVFAGGESEEGEDPWKQHWVAHGVCASIAWAILVPLAIGSSVLRKQLFSSPDEGITLWFQIHRALNTLAAILTVISFAIAVYTIQREDGKSPGKEYSHFIVGLVIFIVTLLQAISGMLRPPAHHLEEPKKEKPEASVVKDLEDSEETEDDKEGHPKNAGVDKDKPAAAAAEEEKKSLMRRLWEYHQRFLDVGLLATALWQIHSGWEFMGEEFGVGENVGNAFLGVAGGISGVIVLLYASSKLQEVLKDSETVYSMVTPYEYVLKSSAADMKRANVVGVQQLLDVCQKVGVPKLLHDASSMAVTDRLLEHVEENEETPLPDWDTYRITYDITKRQGEDMVQNANDSDNSSNFETGSLGLGSILGGPGDYLTRSFLETPGSVPIPTGYAKIDCISARDINVAFFKASDKLDASSSSSTIAGSALFVTKCRTNQSSSSSGEILRAFCHPELEWKPMIVTPFVQSALATGARGGAYQGINGIQVTPTEEDDNTLEGMPSHFTLETGRYELTFDDSLARQLLDFEPEETWQDAISRIAGEIREELPHLFPKYCNS